MKWLVGSVVCAFLLLTPMVGMLSMPWAPIWFGQGQQGHATVDTTVGQPNTLPPLVLPTFVPGRPTLVPVPEPSGPTTRSAALIANAMTWLGVHYQWGGCTVHGIDCSCFVRNVYLSIGVSIPRTTTEQIRFATPISASQAVAGDLVFFDNTCTGCGANPTHVGMVLGEGRMIDAGDPVRIEAIYPGHNARYGRIP